jgi:hypothetical protein
VIWGIMRKFIVKTAVLGLLATCLIAAGEARAASVVCVKKATGIMRYLDTAPIVKKDKKTKKTTTVTPACDAATEIQLVWNKEGVAGPAGPAGPAGGAGAKGADGGDGVAGSDGNGYGPFSYKIGDTGPGGGIVFFIDRYNEYAGFTYLEVAPNAIDADTSGAADAIVWSTTAAKCYADAAGSTTADQSCASESIYPDTVSGTTRTASRATSTRIGSGSANTLAIIARHDAVDPATSKALYAAGSADNYSNTPSGGTAVTDWFLPSYSEMVMMFQNFSQFKPGAITLSATGTCSAYWTSSETAAATAWRVTPNSRTWPLAADAPAAQAKSTSALSCVLPIRQF